MVGEGDDVTFDTWVFPRIGGKPQNGWFIMEKNPIKMDDFGGTTIFGKIHITLRIFGPSNGGV